ncbi:MAG TPA: DcrB-related protein [bacterium]|nr:DcrB-related protein [bacterium]
MDRMGNIRRFRRRAGSLAILLSTLLLALPGTAQATAGWQTYTHPQLGFSLSYPDEWVATNGPSGVVFMVLGPAAAGAQNFRLNVNVTSEELPSGINVEDYEAQNESGLGLLFTGYRRLRSDRLLIGSYPAVVRYYTWKRGDGVELYQLQLVTLAGSRGYVVTGTTTTASTRLADEAKLLVSILLTFRPK